MSEFAMKNLTGGQMNAIVKKLGGEEGALSFLRGEIVVTTPTRNWREQDGVIYFTITSNGRSGEEWITHLEGKGLRLSNEAKFLLRSADFKSTTGVVTEVAVLKGMLFNDSDRLTKNIRTEAGNRKYENLNPEAACLIRDMFTDAELEAMGLYWIVVMHESIKDSVGNPSLLGADRDDGGSWLDAYWVKPDFGWNRQVGFAFSVSQVELKTEALGTN